MSDQPVPTALDSARVALERGEWAAARDVLQPVVDAGESAEAAVDLSSALWWLGDMAGCIDLLERAYAWSRKADDGLLSATCALRLAFHHHEHLASPAAAAGWLARAARIVGERSLRALEGELTLLRATLEEDPVAGEAWAREALERGRATGEVDLELCALAQLGALLVAQGRTREGIALVDEAMAACLGGEAKRIDTVAFTSCTMMMCCLHGADFDRALQWIRATERFAGRYSSPFHDVECRTIHGAVLFATGAWAQAEETLKRAIELSRAFVPRHHIEGLATLAQLRIAQGRTEEAIHLVAGAETHSASVPVLARAYLAAGRADLAEAAARGRLDAIERDRLESGVILEILGEAVIAQGRSPEAAELGRGLLERGQRCDSVIFAARGARLLGHALVESEPESAAHHLGVAEAAFTGLGMPYEAARARLARARALRAVDPAAAELAGRASLAAFETLGARTDADHAAALLRALGVKAGRGGPGPKDELSRREEEVLELVALGLSNPEIAARLFLSRKTVEHHVASILAKLGLRSRSEAAAAAVRRGRALGAARDRDPPKNG